MLFVTIFSYEPDKRDEVIKRVTSQGTLVPEGTRELGQWSFVGGGKVFRIVDIDDPMVAYRGTYAWSDLGKVEICPVIETNELVAMLASQ